jgi:hypothetical protein
MNRRQALTLMATASAAAWTPVQIVAARAKANAAVAATRASQGAFVPAFFTEHEHATVRLLVDLIIPADERSGSATDAGVPAFMDFMMLDRPTMQGWMRGGLAWLDIECQERFDVTFLDADEAQRTAILDAIAWPDQAGEDLSHGVAFFNRFRDLTAAGFWTSKMGIEDLGYIGNVAVPDWNGCPDDVLRRLGLPTGGD